MHYEVEDVLAEADRVVALHDAPRWRGEHDIALRGVFRLQVADGVITHRTDYWDGQEFLRQTGQG